MGPRDFDELRSAFPHLGFALYALEPGGSVELEIHASDGQIFPFRGPTLAAVLRAAFPPVIAEPEPLPVTNVFD